MSITNNESPEIVLVMGADACGKTTFLNGLGDSAYDTSVEVIEPRGTTEIRQFHRDTHLIPIDRDFIELRQTTFMSVHSQIAEGLDSTDRNTLIATSAHPAITYVAHRTMLETIGEPTTSFDDCVNEALARGAFTPDHIVLLEAPIETITTRINERIEKGDKDEVLWGFNSLFYLELYQKALTKLYEHLRGTKNIDGMRFDTSVFDPEEVVEKFHEHRANRASSLV